MKHVAFCNILSYYNIELLYGGVLYMNIADIVIAVLTLLASIISLFTVFYQLGKVRKDLNEIQVVVNTKEMRQALTQPFEGKWSVSGTFTKFQGVNDMHNSSGCVMFNWNAQQENYEVIYMYSVRKAYDNKDVVTAFSSGNARLNDNNKLELNLKMDSRSAVNNTIEENRTFQLISESTYKNSGNAIKEIKFSFINKSTAGEIFFRR